MKVLAFRIQDYKSVKDTGWCYLSNDITILAGKNESGKTAILEALRDFDLEVESFSEEVFPLDESTKNYPSVSLRVSLEKSEKRELISNYSEHKEYLGKVISKEIDIIKSAINRKGQTAYTITDLSDEMQTSHAKHTLKFKDEYSGMLSSTSEEFRLEYPLSEFPRAKTYKALKEFTDEISSSVEFYQEAIINAAKVRAKERVEELSDESSEEEKAEAEKLEYTEKEKADYGFLQAVGTLIQKTTSTQTEENEIKGQIVEAVPNFVFFSSFEDILPFEIPIKQTKSNSAVQDFFKAADIDIDAIASRGNKQRRDNTLRQKSVSITGDFQEFWKQDKITLKPHIDGENIIFEFEEDGRVETFSFEQRSKGFQWFLTFYLKLTVEQSKTQSNILLIDEPGLYLHAKAQQDVLKIFERLSKSGFHVVISTHSPYLIDISNVQRLKLVQRSKSKGTKILNKVHAGATKDTLTPIKTAIGIDVGPTLHATHQHNLVTEGISDYYYIQAFQKILAHESDVSILPSTGATNVSLIASILIGWGFKVAGLFDNDTGGRSGANKLKALNLDEKFILTHSDPILTIEDCFSDQSFNQIVMKDFENIKSYDNKNETMKSVNADKVLVALKFHSQAMNETITENDLDDETKNNFRELLTKIDGAFS